MTAKRLKRPRDPVQLGKLIGDILTGQVEDAHDRFIAFTKGKSRGGDPGSVVNPLKNLKDCDNSPKGRWYMTTA